MNQDEKRENKSCEFDCQNQSGFKVFGKEL
jgi:hypothetical protein